MNDHLFVYATPQSTIGTAEPRWACQTCSTKRCATSKRHNRVSLQLAKKPNLEGNFRSGFRATYSYLTELNLPKYKLLQGVTSF
jgi:hypothetical protein